MSKTLATLSKSQAGVSFASNQIAYAANTPTHTKPAQTPKGLLGFTSTNPLKNVSECSIEKGVALNTDVVVSSLEKAHLSGLYSHYQIFLRAGLDINRCLSARGTTLTYAVFQNGKMLVSYLLKYGADPNSFTEATLRCTPVEIAVSMGSLDIVQLLCQAGADLNGERSEVLQRAAQRGDSEVVTLLLDYGAKVDHIPSQHELDWLKPRSTALHEVCSSSSRAVIQVLILRGADIEQKDWAGKTVLNRAPETGADANDIVLTLRNHLVTEVMRRCDW
jgi:ankyrin repeat protein